LTRPAERRSFGAVANEGGVSDEIKPREADAALVTPEPSAAPSAHDEAPPAAPHDDAPVVPPAEHDPANDAPGQGNVAGVGGAGRAAAVKPRKSRPRGSRGLRLPRRFKKAAPGSEAGIEPQALAPVTTKRPTVRVTCIDYSPAQAVFEDVQDMPEFIERHRQDWSSVRWINVDGLGDLAVVRAIAEKYRLHPLAIEDVLHVPQRPKVQAYEDDGTYQARLFIITRELELREAQLHTEQVSIFVGHRTVLTFQESPGDVWNPIRQRIKMPGSTLRVNDASFLAYSLIDAIVDEAFPILEQFGDRLEELEDVVLQRPSPDVIQEIHRLKRELLLVRRAMWPMREVLSRMQRDPHECFSDVTRTYMRDVYDHAVQAIDIVETYREVAGGLTETYMTAISIRMNEVMKVLTVIGTIFIPLTFFAGVYGMNFEYLPEFKWRYGYHVFWLICFATAGTMVAWFRRKGWL
jgi:magnesium transporter